MDLPPLLWPEEEQRGEGRGERGEGREERERDGVAFQNTDLHQTTLALEQSIRSLLEFTATAPARILLAIINGAHE